LAGLSLLIIEPYLAKAQVPAFFGKTRQVQERYFSIEQILRLAGLGF
jgi:hypothetical protein